MKVDIDKNQDLAQQYNITSVPTFLLFKNGRKVSEIQGANIPQLERDIQQHATTSEQQQEKPAEPIPTFETANEYKDAGNKFFAKADWKTAAELYTKAIALDPSVAAYYSNRAACYLQLKNYKDALKDSLKCTELDPKFSKGYLRAGTAYTCMGLLNEAAMQLQRALAIEPGNAAVKTELTKIEQIKSFVEEGQKELNAERYQQALNKFDRALNLASMSTRIKLYKLEAQLGLGESDLVAKEAGYILRDEDPNNSEAYFLRGKALYYSGQAENGLKHLTQALQLDPDHSKSMQFRKVLRRSEALKEEGNDLFKSGKYQEAIEKYGNAIENDPKNKNLNAQLYCNRSACQGKLNNWDSAIEDASKAIELNPQYLKAYLRRAQCYQQVQKFEEAKRDYHKASEIEPENREVKQKLKEAEQLYKKAKRKDYYKILDISKDADTEDVKKAYKKAAKLWHPDKFQDEEEKRKAEEMFKDIGEAHDVLTDSQKRRRYDSGVDLEDMGQGGGFEGGDINDIMRMFMGGGGGGGMGGMRFGGGSRGGMGGMGGFSGFF